MSTSASEKTFAQALDATEDQIQAFYSLFLFTVMVGMTPGMLFAVRKEAAGLGFSVIGTVATTWLRWFAVLRANYQLAYLTVFINGASAWTIMSLPSQISQRHFPPSRWTLTTSLAIQANYAGWFIGAVVPPLIATDPHRLERLSLVQAILTLGLLLVFLFVYACPGKGSLRGREFTQSVSSGASSLALVVAEAEAGAVEGGAPQPVGHSHSFADGSFASFFGVCVKHPRLPAMITACGVLAGVSFAQPSASIFILAKYGYTDAESQWVNAAFIGSGVCFGIFIGWACSDSRHFGIVLKSLFLLCTLSIGCTAALAMLGLIARTGPEPLHPHPGPPPPSPHPWALLYLVLLGSGAGLSSLGFLGVGIEACAAYPAGAGYVCWAIEIICQGVGGGLNFAAGNSHGFVLLGWVTAGATLLMLVGYAPPQSS